LKIRVFLGWSKFVSACVERDKKILKKWIFALVPLHIWSIFRISTLKDGTMCQCHLAQMNKDFVRGWWGGCVRSQSVGVNANQTQYKPKTNPIPEKPK